jgi:hypothetical protein
MLFHQIFTLKEVYLRVMLQRQTSKSRTTTHKQMNANTYIDKFFLKI